MMVGKEWTIVRYQSDNKALWDTFIDRSRNGVFLFKRDYMDYHADRFQDHSLLCFQEKTLMAVLPAHTDGTVLASHDGLTFGGFLITEKMTAQAMLDLFVAVRDYLNHEGITLWRYRAIPYIYDRYPSQEDLYALYRMEARLVSRKISSVVPLAHPLPFSTLRRRKVKQAVKAQFRVLQDSDFAPFWSVLEKNLRERHQVHPVHTLSEIELLHARFPEHIVLYRVVDLQGATVGGCVMYLSDRVAHVQYIASTEEGRHDGALDLLFGQLIQDTYSQKAYFDFGVSVECGGLVLNEGLIFQKEGFGGRGVVYDVYELNIS